MIRDTIYLRGVFRYLYYFLWLICCCLSLSAQGSTFSVTNGNDAGTGSLRQAVTLALLNPGADIIDISSTVYIINFTTTDPLTIGNNLPNLSDLTINGNNVIVKSSVDSRFASLGDQVTINNFRFLGFKYSCLHIFPSDNVVVSINNCLFINCKSTGTFPFAGAIWHVDGELALTSCTFSNCSGPLSGAIFSQVTSDKLYMSDCTFFSNTSANIGGLANAIYLQGSLHVELAGMMSFSASPIQDIFMSVADTPFAGSIDLLPGFATSLGDVFEISH